MNTHPDTQENANQIREGMLLEPDGLSIDLMYPRVDGRIQHLKVGLMDVRAADSIRISYDFKEIDLAE